MFVHILVAQVEMPFLLFLRGGMCQVRILRSLLVIFFSGKGKSVSLIYNMYSSKVVLG